MNLFSWQSSSTHVTIMARDWHPSVSPKAVVALVHGLGEHSGRYQHVADYFNQLGIAITALDNYGHGKSGGKRGHIPKYENYMALMLEFLDQTRQRYPNLPVFLYGHSMGGNLVLNYVLRRQLPDLAGVIATGPAIKPGFEPPKLIVTLGKLTRKIFPSFTQSNQLDVTGISRDKAVVEAYQNDPLVHDRLSSETGIGILEWGDWLYNNAHTTPVPLLLLHGTKDRLTSPAASQHFFEQLKGDVTFRLWDGLYHELHNEPEQAEVLGYIAQWMEQKLNKGK
ncbi:MAG: alpha/beta hydrolase [Spirosomataceae bacterium]